MNTMRRVRVPSERRAGELLAVSALVASLLLVSCTILGRIINRHVALDIAVPDLPIGSSWFNAVAAVMWAVPGWFLANRRPKVAFGWLALCAGLAHGVAGLGLEWAIASQIGGHDLPGTGIASWISNWGPIVELPVLATIYALFPEGRLVRGPLRWGSVTAIGLTLGGLVLTILDPFPFPSTSDPRLASLSNPVGVGAFRQVAEHYEALIAPGMILATLLVVLRWHRANGEHRRLLGWLATSASITTVLVVPSVLLLPPAVGVAIGQGTTGFEILVIVAAVSEHRVYGIDSALNRTLTYSVLTLVAATVYGAAIAFGAAIGQQRSVWWSFAAAVAIGVMLSPFRLVAQRFVNRLLYGQRDDPFAVLARSAAGLGATGDIEAMLDDFVETVRGTLRVPYVAIQLVTADSYIPAIEAGVPAHGVEQFAMNHRGQPIGELSVATRRGEIGFSGPERVLINQLASQAAVAAANVALTADLRRSRQRTVLAREEERRRLRRDLHDGLGSQLTGVALGLDAAAERLGTSDPSTAAEIERLRTEVTEAIDDVRRLVHALRPPRLDDAGLGVALDELANRTSRAGLRVHVQRPAVLPALDVAVETALYRIAAEALTNVARHARATRCDLIIEAEPHRLCLSLCDNGLGVTGIASYGVGLTSMRERAEEVGGTFECGNRPVGGYRIDAVLPVRSCK